MTQTKRESATALQHESGLRIQSDDIEIFCKSIESGNWDDAVYTSQRIDFTDDTGKIEVKGMILERKFVELLEKKNVKDALELLQNELKHIISDTSRLTILSNLIICPNKSSLRNMITSLNIPSSRRLLQEKIKSFISPSQLVQENRLECLILKSLQSQIQNSRRQFPRRPSIFTNPSNQSDPRVLYGMNTMSLLYDNELKDLENGLPGQHWALLKQHQDEVWCLAFSPDGRYLATGSADGQIYLWDALSFLMHRGNTRPYSTPTVLNGFRSSSFSGNNASPQQQCTHTDSQPTNRSAKGLNEAANQIPSPSNQSGATNNKYKPILWLRGNSADTAASHLAWSSDSAQLLAVGSNNNHSNLVNGSCQRPAVLRWEIWKWREQSAAVNNSSHNNNVSPLNSNSTGVQNQYLRQNQSYHNSNHSNNSSNNSSRPKPSKDYSRARSPLDGDHSNGFHNGHKNGTGSSHLDPSTASHHVGKEKVNYDDSEKESLEELGCRERYEMHTAEITCATWIPTSPDRPLSPDLQFFISGSVDRQLLLCDLWGCCLAKSFTGRIGSVAVLFPHRNIDDSPQPTGPRRAGGRWFNFSEEHASALPYDLNYHRNGDNNNNHHHDMKNDEFMKGSNDDPEVTHEFKSAVGNDLKDSKSRHPVTYDTNNNNNRDHEELDLQRILARESLIGYRIIYINSERHIKVLVLEPNESASIGLDSLSEFCSRNTSATTNVKKFSYRESLYHFVEIASLSMGTPILSLSLSCDYLQHVYSDYHQRSHVKPRSTVISPSSSVSSVVSSAVLRTPFLLAMEGGDLQLAELEVTEDGNTVLSLSRRISGPRQARLCLTPALRGNIRNGYIACGTEDRSDLFIWNAADGTLLTTLKGHSGVVNAVAWCPEVSPGDCLLGTVSDDHSVRVWSSRGIP